MESHPPSQKLVDSSNHETGNEIDQVTEELEKLPKIETCWSNGHPLYKYQGFWYPLLFLKVRIASPKQFEAQPTDIILTSFQKTGTTWLKSLSFAIATRNKYDPKSTDHPLCKANSHDFVLFVEDFPRVQQRRASSEYPPIFASHSPYPTLPDSVISSDHCKIVYIYRDPKDTLVSFWHFMKKWLVKPEEQENDIPFDEAFRDFCDGIVHFGPYWDHVLSYYKASLEKPGKILMLKYEDLKKDASGNVKRLAEFMGFPFSELEEKEGVLDSVLKLCSFENQRSLEVNQSGKFLKETPFAFQTSSFFRSGKVGDWENHFTAEMKEKMDQITKETLGDFGLF